MSIVQCSMPECQTTAGCKCGEKPEYHGIWHDDEMNSLRSQLAAARAEIERLNYENETLDMGCESLHRTVNDIIAERDTAEARGYARGREDMREELKVSIASYYAAYSAGRVAGLEEAASVVDNHPDLNTIGIARTIRDLKKGPLKEYGAVTGDGTRIKPLDDWD